jgi:hypothetical protein
MTSKQLGGEPVVHFASEAAFIAFVKSGVQETVVSMGGDVPMVRTCKGIERSDWTSEDVNYSTDVAGLHKSAVNAMLEARHSAGFKINTGNDIRVTKCFAAQTPPLPKGWEAHVVASAAGVLGLRYAHMESHKWSRVRPKGDEKVKHVGFEFRLMDNMPRSALLPLLRFLVLVAAASASSRAPCANPSQDADWAAQAADALVMGCYAPASRAFLDKLRARLSLRKRPAATSWEALLALCGDLHAKYAKHPWTRLLTASPDVLPALENVNEAGWRHAFLAKHDLPQDFATLPGWVHDLPFLKSAKP